jgi:hypothetical protein
MPAQPHLLPWFYLAAGTYAGSLLFFLCKRNRSSLGLLSVGIVAHGISLFQRLYHYELAVPMNLFTELYFLPLLLAVATLLLGIPRQGSRHAPTLLIPLNFFMLLALMVPTTVTTPSPFAATTFASAFFCSEVAAHALFIIAGWYAALFLTNRSTEQIFNSFAIWGFILYSIAQVIGAVWSWLGWAVPFHWSERHLVSAAIWCFYCAYLHLHFSSRWSARDKAWLTMGGALLLTGVTYAYYFVNMGS